MHLFCLTKAEPCQPAAAWRTRCGQRVASRLDAQPSVAQTGATFNCPQVDHPLLWEGAAGASVPGMLVRMIERSLLGWRADHAEKPS
jgi:hypothetical protein